MQDPVTHELEQPETSIGKEGLHAVSVAYSLDIKGLSKKFKRRTMAGRGGCTTIKSALLSLLGLGVKAPVLYTTAVQDLTVRVLKGSSVGIIGRNGSGKSSLLKLITGIYKPDAGSVEVVGQIAALIELGAGFHPDFTGRENLFLAGAMHGLTRRQVQARIPDIVRFAELEDVIDDPVRTYSSGMFMRLGFSLAVHIDPDILIIDEVLAVGDAGFVAKCKDRIGALRRSGKTLLLVSHDLDAVERWCDEVVWLEKGAVKDRGEPRRVIDQYRKWLETGEEQELVALEQEARADEAQQSAADQAARRWGSREIEILSCSLNGASGESHRLFHPDDTCEIEIRYACRAAVPEVEIVFGVAIHRNDGLLVLGTNTDIERVAVPALAREGVVRFAIDRLALVEGAYSVDVAVHSKEGYPYDYRKELVDIVIRSPVKFAGVFSPVHTWRFD